MWLHALALRGLRWQAQGVPSPHRFGRALAGQAVVKPTLRVPKGPLGAPTRLGTLSLHDPQKMVVITQHFPGSCTHLLRVMETPGADLGGIPEFSMPEMEDSQVLPAQQSLSCGFAFCAWLSCSN